MKVCGFLTLKVQVFIQGNEVRVVPNARPGEAVAPRRPEVIEKTVTISYPAETGLQARLVAAGYEIGWTRPERVSTLVNVEGYEVVIEPDARGVLAHFRTRDGLVLAKHRNLRSGVTRAHRYDPEINPSYQDFAAHYDLAILPARVRKPRDKAKVEAGVLIVERWVLARLRNCTFFSLGELNTALSELLARLNARAFKKLEGSRQARFATLDKPALRAVTSSASGRNPRSIRTITSRWAGRITRCRTALRGHLAYKPGVWFRRRRAGRPAWRCSQESEVRFVTSRTARMLITSTPSEPSDSPLFS